MLCRNCGRAKRDHGLGHYCHNTYGTYFAASGREGEGLGGVDINNFEQNKYDIPNIKPNGEREYLPMAEFRTFETGATRDLDADKLDYEGFLAPIVLKRFAEYMHQNRKQADGSLRSSDNWQKGIPQEAYMKSMVRHMMEVWELHRNYKNSVPGDGTKLVDALCAVIFNAQGYLFEELK